MVVVANSEPVIDIRRRGRGFVSKEMTSIDFPPSNLFNIMKGRLIENMYS